jgi:Kdo2-lipid IVA lauroyltransferase/acyltransferase
MAISRLARLRRGARSALLPALVRLLAFLPRGAAMALATLAARIGWRVAGRTRRLMLAHLAVAFPERSPAEREALGRASLRHLAWVGAEMITIRHYDAELVEYVSFAPGAEERVRAALAHGRGLVYVTGHIGNWELMARRMARAGIPSATIAKASDEPELNAMFQRMRSDGGYETLWREDPGTARAMIRCFHRNKLLGILIDQDTRVQGVHVPFFGHLAYTPRAAGDLAMRFRAPVVVGWSRRRGPAAGDGHVVDVVDVPYDADAADRDRESVRLTAACTRALEDAIRQAPEEWVWMHRRWKRRPEGEASHPAATARV